MIRKDYRSGVDVGVDDLPCLLNMVQIDSLNEALRLAPEHRRPFVLIAWLELDQARWAHEAGFEPPTLLRWLQRYNRLPFGAAVRLARVVGLDPVMLFEGYV